MLFAYARVSTVDQDTKLQLDAFNRLGVDRIFEDQASGVARRPALECALYSLRKGDVLIVYKVDRLARSLSDLLRVVDRIAAAGASFKSITEPLDTSTPVGRMMLQLLGTFAEFERSVIRERCMAGRAAAVRRGVKFGRPAKVDVSALPELVSAGLNAGQIADIFNCDRSSVAHWLRRAGLNPSSQRAQSLSLVEAKRVAVTKSA